MSSCASTREAVAEAELPGDVLEERSSSMMVTCWLDAGVDEGSESHFLAHSVVMLGGFDEVC